MKGRNLIVFVIITLFLVSCSKKPVYKEPVPRSGALNEMSVAGIKVLNKPAQNEVIHARLFIRGGTRNYPAEKAGIENFALQMVLESGTKYYPRKKFHRIQEENGIHMSGESTLDYGVLSLRCTKDSWNKAWGLFSEVINEPTFKKQVFDSLKRAYFTELMDDVLDIKKFLQQKALASVFNGHRYGIPPKGTPRTIQSLRLMEVAQHYRNIMNKNNIFLVVAGNLDSADLKKKVKSAFSTLGEPEETVAEKEAPLTIEPGVEYIQRGKDTSFIYGICDAPDQSFRKKLAMRLALSMLGKRVKEKLEHHGNGFRNVEGVLRGVEYPFSVFSFMSREPENSIRLVKAEIRRVREHGFRQTELDKQIHPFLAGYYMEHESNGAQALALGKAELHHGWQFAESLPELVRNTSLEKINKIFKENTNAIKWFSIGIKRD